MNYPYNPEIHHRLSIRLKDYDYSSAGAYFITIIVKNRECNLGDIVDGEIILSELGKIVKKYLLTITEKYEDTLFDEFVVMPNHIHFILVITNSWMVSPGDGAIRELPLHTQPLREDGCDRDFVEDCDIGSDRYGSSVLESEETFNIEPKRDDNKEKSTHNQLSSVPTGSFVRVIHELPSSRPDIATRRKMLLSKIIGYVKTVSAKNINIYQNTQGTSFWHKNYILPGNHSGPGSEAAAQKKLLYLPAKLY